MAFNFNKIKILEQKEDIFELPQEQRYHFDSFMKQFNDYTKKHNSTDKDLISLKYYLMNECLIFETLEDCDIPLIEHDLCSEDKFIFDIDLSFRAQKGYIFKWSFEKNTLFKDLLKKGLSYYKNRKTTEKDLVYKHTYEELMEYFRD